MQNQIMFILLLYQTHVARWNLWWRGSSDPIIFDQAHVKVCELKLNKFVPFFQDRAPDDGSKFYDAFLTEAQTNPFLPWEAVKVFCDRLWSL